MADNIPVTPGSGAALASDDIGGVHYQRVKISLGADGSAADAPGDGTNGMRVHHAPGPTTADVTRVLMTGSAVTLIASRAARKHLIIYNGSGVAVDVKFGSGASSTDRTFRLADGGSYEMPFQGYTGVVTANGASGYVDVTEIY